MHCITWAALVFLGLFSGALCRHDEWNDVPCTEHYMPKNCDLSKLDLVTVDDYDRCGPAFLSIDARNHFLGAAGRRITYKDNKDAFDKIQIRSKMLRGRDASEYTLSTQVLGLEVDFPIGVSPVAYHRLASEGGELDTVRGLSGSRTIMILSMYSTSALEDVAAQVKEDGFPHLFMQIYLFQNRSLTLETVRRAEEAGFKALVVTTDSPILGTVTCNSRAKVRFPPGVGTPNTNNISIADGGLLLAKFEDLTWLAQNTKLPIIAKGILSGEDAVSAIEAGAAAVMVSNHGGRQIDGDPATINALPGVVEAVKAAYPNVDVLMDCGVRSGNDVFKAIARGATMAFIGRPSIFGLAIKGSDGVREVINLLKNGFNETMIVSGASNPNEITRDFLIEPPNIFYA